MMYLIIYLPSVLIILCNDINYSLQFKYNTYAGSHARNNGPASFYYPYLSNFKVYNKDRDSLTIPTPTYSRALSIQDPYNHLLGESNINSFDGWTTNKPYFPQLPPLTTPLPEVVDAKSLGFQTKEEIESDLDFKILKMICSEGPEGKFEIQLKVPLGFTDFAPVFEDVENTVEKNSCNINVKSVSKLFSIVEISLSSIFFAVCGVKVCQGDEEKKSICVRLRFPIVNHLKSVGDIVMTLRCRAQELMMIHNKRISLPVDKGVELRSTNDLILDGGATNRVKCNIDILKKDEESQFTKTVKPYTEVYLGEELLIRVVIVDGDGWQFSRLGEVTLEGAEKQKVALLSTKGCVLPQVRSICPHHPRQENALTHTFLIRAPMFQKSSGPSNIQLSVHVIACVHEKNCTSHCRTLRSSPATNTDDNPVINHEEHSGNARIESGLTLLRFNKNLHLRSKRHANESKINLNDKRHQDFFNNTKMDSFATVSFVVVDSYKEQAVTPWVSGNKKPIIVIVMAGLLILLLLICLGLMGVHLKNMDIP